MDDGLTPMILAALGGIPKSELMALAKARRGKRGAVGGKSPNEGAGTTAPLQLTDGTTTASGALPIGAAGATAVLPPRTGIRTDRDTVDITMMTVIHEAKADLERHDQEGDTALLAACRMRRSAAIRTLLAFGASARVSGSVTQLTPLHAVCGRFQGHERLAFVRQLLDAKANAWAISRGGSTPVNLLLRNCSADCAVTGTAVHPDVQCLRLLFAAAPTQAPALPKVLVLACRKASVEVVHALLALLLPEGCISTTESIADVADVADVAGVAETTPAGSHVSLCGDFDIGKCSTAKGLTPLLCVIRRQATRGRTYDYDDEASAKPFPLSPEQKLEMVHVLLEYKAALVADRLDPPGHGGYTAIEHSIRSRSQVALVQLLLQKKANPGRASSSSAPSLCALAIGDDQLQTTLLLLEYKADPNTLTLDTETTVDASMTPLMLCCKQVAMGSKSPLVMQVTAALLEAQANVNVQNRFGWTALGVCVFTALLPGQPEPLAEHEDSVCRVLEDLLQAKADVNRRKTNGTTVLHDATRPGPRSVIERSLLVGSRRARLQHRVMRLLLKARGDVNLLEKPSEGAKGKKKRGQGRCSPLMLLCSSSLPTPATTACVSLLLGDPSIKVNLVCPDKGGTALDFLVLAAQRTAEDQHPPGSVAARHPKTENISWLDREERDRTARVRAKIRESVAAKSNPRPRVGDAMAASAQRCRRKILSALLSSGAVSHLFNSDTMEDLLGPPLKQSQVLQPTTGLPAGSTTVRCNGCGKSRLHKPIRDQYGARVAQTYYRCEHFAVCVNCFDRMFKHLADQPDAGVEKIPASESAMEEKNSQVVAVAAATPDVDDANMDEET